MLHMVYIAYIIIDAAYSVYSIYYYMCCILVYIAYIIIDAVYGVYQAWGEYWTKVLEYKYKYLKK